MRGAHARVRAELHDHDALHAVGTGARAATIALADNEPTTGTIALSGTGVAAHGGPAGAQGPQGPTGPQGPQGATGARGPAGEIELVSCTTVTKTVNKRRVTRQRCTAKLVSGKVTFTTTPALATLTRAGAVYATGTEHLTRLVLHTRRAIPPGRYLLILRRRDGRRWTTAREPVTWS